MSLFGDRKETGSRSFVFLHVVSIGFSGRWLMQSPVVMPETPVAGAVPRSQRRVTIVVYLVQGSMKPITCFLISLKELYKSSLRVIVFLYAI